jgi:deoxycytidylate deaminase
MNKNLISRTAKLAGLLCPVNREVRTSHIAFLTKGGKIVHVGWNKNRTHPENLKHPYHNGLVGLHAELDVCLKSGKDELNGYEMVVIRIDRKGKMCNSKPCRGCQSVIRQFGVGKVWHSDENGNIVKMYE